MEKIIKVINELNQHLFDVVGDGVEHRFIHQTDGYVNIIAFDEVVLYNSENEHIESPDLKDYIMQKFNDYVDKIKQGRFNLPELKREALEKERDELKDIQEDNIKSEDHLYRELHKAREEIETLKEAVKDCKIKHSIICRAELGKKCTCGHDKLKALTE